jgi:translation initiation factor IF-2
MADEKVMRLSQVARKLNVGLSTIAEHLETKGFEVEHKPNAKISVEQFEMLAKEFASSAMDKKEASGLTIGQKHSDNLVIDSVSESTTKKREDEEEIFIKNISAPQEETIEVKPEPKPAPAPEATLPEPPPVEEETPEKAPSSKTVLQGIKVVGKIDLDQKKEEKPVEPEPEKTVEEKEEEKEGEKEPESPKEEPREVIQAKADALKGLTVLGKIELPKEKPVASSDDKPERKKKKRPRRRIAPSGTKRSDQKGRGDKRSKIEKEDVSEKEIQEQIKATLAKLSGGKGNVSRAKYRREKRSAVAEAEEEKILQQAEDAKVLKVTEFISANDLATLMDVSVNEVISTCMSLGLFVSINQRLDAESITVISDEFGYNVEFTSSEDEVTVAEHQDSEEELLDRAPIVTIMGHVDHGKTSLLDYIRSANVTADEAGGITQHIGAYDVTTEDGKRIAFLDTPGHEAFTAMRARGAKITDVVIIVVAADDNVMPQTKEAINHAQVAGVPIVIAINKIDKPNANAEKIKEELSKINILVEDWGGKYQSQEISAKTGAGIGELLEKVLLESELLELKANPDKNAVGTVIEATLDKGRGYVTTLMVQAGNLKVGDVMLAGSYFGKVKAMFDYHGTKLQKVGPSTPAAVLGLDGAPQAGDKFNVMDSEREAREIATKREQIQREQSIRTKKHITLDEIGRRLAIGSFQELNVIVKGDVDGSVEALSDSLLKLSTDEIQVNIVHKGVGQISESDVLLATASDAVIVGFQVRPSNSARDVAENEEIEIRLYSVIYDAINDVKDAMEGMLAPTVEEVITGNVEVREVFKISKVGTVAGCYVTHGLVKRNNQIRLVRDGIVVHTGAIGQLKRFKDDVSEVKSGYECGISLKSFKDIQVSDVIEGFEEKEVKRTL